LVKINPGSKIHGDNETRRATAGSEKIPIAEPKIVEHGRFECPDCGKIYKSREDYDSHALSQHSTEVAVEPP
jgi:predicted RNA-binding Zn-ribbon protein involved in translation (DUF1610 family)